MHIDKIVHLKNKEWLSFGKFAGAERVDYYGSTEGAKDDFQNRGPLKVFSTLQQCKRHEHQETEDASTSGKSYHCDVSNSASDDTSCASGHWE